MQLESCCVFPLTFLFSFEDTVIALGTILLFLCSGRVAPVHVYAPFSQQSILKFRRKLNKKEYGLSMDI